MRQWPWRWPVAWITLALMALAACTAGDESPPRSGDESPRRSFPEATAWRRLEPAPSKRTEVTAVAARGRILVIGGFAESGETVATVEVYSPGSDEWEAGPDLPVALNHASSAELDGTVYVFGGYRGPALTNPSDLAFALRGDRW